MQGRRVVHAYVGLGSNVGDSPRTLADAVLALGAVSGVRLTGVSRLYATTPVGVRDQPEFSNAVVALAVRARGVPEDDALVLLAVLKELERSSGRLDRGRWGPRELDLDLLVFGRARIAVERPPALRAQTSAPTSSTSSSFGGRFLVVPHAEARDRLFVLAPLADLAPGLVPPGWGERVETARRRRLQVEGEEAVRPIASWDADARDWRRLRHSSDPPAGAPVGIGPGKAGSG